MKGATLGGPGSGHYVRSAIVDMMERPGPGRPVVLLTGGSGGLGRVIAGNLSAEGLAVGLLGRSADRLEVVGREIRENGGVAATFAADLLDQTATDRAMAGFREWAGGRCDALVCAAGRLRGIGPVGLVEVEEWALDLTTGLVGAIRAVRGVLPELRRTPGSSVTLLVGPGMNGELAHASGYGAAQAGLARLAETLDTEFGAAGPRVYAVNPGIVPTPLMDHILNSPAGRKWLPRFTEAFGEGKEVGPEAAAELVAWLVARCPAELGGRVIGALGVPEFLETRLARIESEDLGRLRLR